MEWICNIVYKDIISIILKHLFAKDICNLMFANKHLYTMINTHCSKYLVTFYRGDYIIVRLNYNLKQINDILPFNVILSLDRVHVVKCRHPHSIFYHSSDIIIDNSCLNIYNISTHSLYNSNVHVSGCEYKLYSVDVNARRLYMNLYTFVYIKDNIYFYMYGAKANLIKICNYRAIMTKCKRSGTRYACNILYDVDKGIAYMLNHGRKCRIDNLQFGPDNIRLLHKNLGRKCEI